MPTYDVAGHYLLSDEAALLTPVQLDAHAETAELVLGLSGTSYDSEQAALAIVHQINHQLAVGASGLVLSSSSRGARSESYRDGNHAKSPIAEAIASRLKGWTTAGPVR